MVSEDRRLADQSLGGLAVSSSPRVRLGRPLIKRGAIVNAGASTPSDVLRDGERIALIVADLDVEAEGAVDATGNWVIPGPRNEPVGQGLPTGRCGS